MVATTATATTLELFVIIPSQYLRASCVFPSDQENYSTYKLPQFTKMGKCGQTSNEKRTTSVFSVCSQVNVPESQSTLWCSGEFQ